MSKVICIGSSSKDIFFPTGEGIITETPDDLMSQRKISFELGAKYHIDNRYEALGGCAANVSCGLSRLGLAVKCYTKIGGDQLGQWIKKELEKKEVGTDLIQIEKNILSDLSSVIVEEKSGERVIFCSRDANENLEIIPENFQAAEWIFVSALNGNEKESWEDHLKKILAVSDGKIKLAFNPGPENIKTNPHAVVEVCRSADVVMVNKDEAIEIISRNAQRATRNNLDDEKFLIQELQKIGAKVVAITDGKNGAWASDGKNIFYAKATGDNPVETTGAGDAFSSGFLAARIKGKNLEECLKWGIANGGNAVKFYGAIEGLLNEEEIMQRIKSIKAKNL